MQRIQEHTAPATIVRRRGVAAIVLGAFGLTVGAVAAMLIVATLGVSAATATSIVNAIIAGSTVATAVAAVLGGGISGAALYVIRQAVLRGAGEASLVA